uniref:Nucleoprotein/polynucleotide-associated enzyme n=1 Tax=uncultured Thiotrichaceae bacterium TaxID=298394 RepID=A0A6S6SA78_9GAMM|nr:MAG: nucleoprotein/polynucleotide-associated enzyme [uncultured Thiotrichaceae bacterium]
MTSLQDQLLKAGLVDKKKAQKSKKAKNKQNYQQNKGQQQKTETDKARELAEKAKQEQAERSRELNRQQREEAEKVAVQAQIRQLITMNRIDRSRGEQSYQFADGNKIQSIYVTDKLQQQLADGIIAIVRFGETYELIPRQVIDKIVQRDESCLVILNDSKDDITAEDDPYADFQIPDDLMW